MDQPQEIHQIPTPTQKIYVLPLILLGTFLGGPLVAGYFMAQNFKAFDEPEKVAKTWTYAIIATIVVFAIVFAIPDSINIPNMLIPMVYTGITFFLVNQFQSENINRHENAGGPLYTRGRMIWISLLGAVLTMIPVITILIVTDPSMMASSKKYGKMNSEISYNKHNISEGEIDEFARAFTEVGFFNDESTNYVYIEHKAMQYEIKVNLTAEQLASQDVSFYYKETLKNIKLIMSNENIAFAIYDMDDKEQKRIE